MKIPRIIPLIVGLVLLSACSVSWEAPIMRHGEKAILDVLDATDGEAVFGRVDWVCMLHEDDDIDDEMCVFYMTYNRDDADHYMMVITSEPDGAPGLVAQRATISGEAVLEAARIDLIEDIEQADTPIRYASGTLDNETIDSWIEARE